MGNSIDRDATREERRRRAVAHCALLAARFGMEEHEANAVHVPIAIPAGHNRDARAAKELTAER